MLLIAPIFLDERFSSVVDDPVRNKLEQPTFIPYRETKRCASRFYNGDFGRAPLVSNCSMKLRFFITCLSTLTLIGMTAVGLAQEFLPKPEDENFTQDYARLIDADDYEKIGDFQQRAFVVYDTPVIVVTIKRMSDYVKKMSIEQFARKWFDSREIGTLNREGGGENKGILLLVSEGDRKARIELGADWGHLWDKHSQKIMDREILPAFRKGDFSGGITAGVAELFEMAKTGPNVEAPGDSVMDTIHEISSKEKITPASLVPGGIGLIALAVGVGCLVLAWFLPDYRGLLIKAGIFIIVGVLLTYVVLFILAILGKASGRGGGGGFSSGGGFSGGFSGGGGASGGW